MATTTTTTYAVESRDGLLLWIGDAESEHDALDQMAREAGYADHAEAMDTIGGEDDITVSADTDGQVLAPCDEDASGILTIRDDSGSIEYLDALQDEGYTLRKISSLRGWEPWRSLWLAESRYDADEHQLYARTIA